MGFPGGSDGKESACHVGDPGVDPVRSQSREDALEEDMATHSSILAWRIPWREEPGGLPSMGVAKSWTNTSTLKCRIPFLRRMS